jgi:oxaloacetate decarboxylase alpha subunit
MVTPYSQFFGVQAAINVMVGARYKEVTDEVLLYALGYWGEEEAQSIEANLRDRLVSSARAKELAKVKPAEFTLGEFRRKFGGDRVSDDDKLLNFFAGEDSLAAMKAAGTPKIYPCSNGTPLVALIEQLSRRKGATQVYIKREGLRLRMEQRHKAD